jgi:hypothetical protein
MEDKAAPWLSWQGYSSRERFSLSGWSEGFSFPSRFFERIPYCIESYAQIRTLSSEDRVALQNRLFDLTDHSVMATIFPGLIRHEHSRWIKEQIGLYTSTAMRLSQLLACQTLAGGEQLSGMFGSLSPGMAAYLRTSLDSSCFFYGNRSCNYFEKTFDHPMYLEIATDLLSNQCDLVFSEFQVRYATPYPHLLTKISRAYLELFPALAERFGLKADSFEDARNRLLARAFSKFETLRSEKATCILLDAWAYMLHSGANWIALARDLKMNYVLFDDLIKSRNIYTQAYKRGRLSIFNQAALSLLDPSHGIFQKLAAEHLEDYDELEWDGLTERYLGGEIFFAHSPVTEILNDKALYPALPELCKFFFDSAPEIPVMRCSPCWLDADCRLPHDSNLRLARNDKNRYVLAHRYLEGGLGIIVGRVTEQAEWERFIDRYVVPRPYLYVLRDHFEMEPDFSLRVLSASLQDSLRESAGRPEVAIADTIYSRFTTDSPLMVNNHRVSLIFPSSVDAPEPRYQFTQ